MLSPPLISMKALKLIAILRERNHSISGLDIAQLRALLLCSRHCITCRRLLRYSLQSI